MTTDNDKPIRLEWRKASELHDNPRNWRTHPPYQEAALKDLISEVGWAGVLLYNERTERLIDGHLRKQVAGDDVVPVLIGSWSDADELKLLASIDPIGAMAQQNQDVLVDLLAEVETSSDALKDLFEAVANDYRALEPIGEPEIPQEETHDTGGALDEAEADDYVPFTKPGQIWQLGKHRLMCGDCTVALGVLVAGDEIAALFTDPPYGINRDPAWLNDVYQHRSALSSSDVLIGDDGSLDLTFLFEYERRMIWGFPYIYDPEATGWIVWDKQPGVESRGIVTPIEVASTTMRKGYDMVRCMWGGYYRAAGEDKQPHPTQKPIGVTLPFIEAWTKPNDIILDPFVGSGTTIIAAERTGRRCYAMEIEPRYCDVSILRYASYVGYDKLFLSTDKGDVRFEDVQEVRENAAAARVLS